MDWEGVSRSEETNSEWLETHFKRKTQRQVVLSTIALPTTGAAPAALPKAAGMRAEMIVFAMPGISIDIFKVRVKSLAPPMPWKARKRILPRN